ncbi:MAG: hypothetical protein NWE95_02235 [Candidatus Bathyarchaeota archaeon]|nr:hypothetical protein [Candidatus Bathyarchaeota archaeon]
MLLWISGVWLVRLIGRGFRLNFLFVQLAVDCCLSYVYIIGWIIHPIVPPKLGTCESVAIMDGAAKRKTAAYRGGFEDLPDLGSLR